MQKSHVIHIVCIVTYQSFMHASRTSHLSNINCIIRYLKTPRSGILYAFHGFLNIEICTDACQAESHTDWRSTVEYFFLVGGNLASKKNMWWLDKVLKLNIERWDSEHVRYWGWRTCWLCYGFDVSIFQWNFTVIIWIQIYNQHFLKYCLSWVDKTYKGWSPYCTEKSSIKRY